MTHDRLPRPRAGEPVMELESPSTALSPAAREMIVNDGDERATWRSLWSRDDTFWDLGQAHPLLPRLMTHASEVLGFSPKQRRVYVPGCGRGHEAAWLARAGAIVDAADYSPEAIDAARICYPESSTLRFVVDDAFERPEHAGQQYDAIVDRAMLCAIGRHDRRRYLEACAHRLRPGGLFVSVAFEAVRVPAGPPFAITRDELMTLGEGHLDGVWFESVPARGMESFVERELLVLMLKPERCAGLGPGSQPRR